MDKYSKVFIKNIKRYASNLSAYEISKISGVSQAALSNYFSGERLPTLEIIIKISKSLNIEPYQLIKDSEEKNIPTDIINMLEGQSDAVYDTIRTMLKALESQRSSKAN